MNVLITGGLGLIGSAVALRLQAGGDQVHVVDSLDPRTGGSVANLPPSFAGEVIDACISDSGIWERLPGHLDVVVNLAGLSGHTYSMTRPDEDLLVNVVAQGKFLRQLLDQGYEPHVLFASTRQVYGTDPDQRGGVIQPADVNAVGKYACEQLHEVLLRGSQARTTILRLSNVYGAAMLRAPYPQGVIGSWLQAAVDGRDLRVTSPSPIRDILHVEDLADLIAIIIRAEPAIHSTDIFDVGGGLPVTLAEVAEHLSRESGSAVAFGVLSDEEDKVAVRNYTSDLSRVQARFDWTPVRDWSREMSAILHHARRERKLSDA